MKLSVRKGSPGTRSLETDLSVPSTVAPGLPARTPPTPSPLCLAPRGLLWNSTGHQCVYHLLGLRSAAQEGGGRAAVMGLTIAGTHLFWMLG